VVEKKVPKVLELQQLKAEKKKVKIPGGKKKLTRGKKMSPVGLERTRTRKARCRKHTSLDKQGEVWRNTQGET